MIDKIAFAIFNFFDKINEKLENLLTFQFPEVRKKKTANTVNTNVTVNVNESIRKFRYQSSYS